MSSKTKNESENTIVTFPVFPIDLIAMNGILISSPPYAFSKTSLELNFEAKSK